MTLLDTPPLVMAPRSHPIAKHHMLGVIRHWVRVGNIIGFDK